MFAETMLVIGSSRIKNFF